jgi:hypothetical protein
MKTAALSKSTPYIVAPKKGYRAAGSPIANITKAQLSRRMSVGR